MTQTRVLARAERADFADLLDQLTPWQWSSPSLCDGWSIRDVVAHTIAYLGQSRRRLVLNMIRSGWNVDRLNARGLRDYVDTPPKHLANLMRAGAEPSGAGALYGGRVALIECLIHQQDVRRALGELRAIPEERLRVSLDYARISPVIAGAYRTRGVRLVAMDISWAAGRGPDVRGPAEALLLAMTGRIADVHDELRGDGVAVLKSRHLRGRRPLMADFRYETSLVRELLRDQHPDLADLALRDVDGGWAGTDGSDYRAASQRGKRRATPRWNAF